MAGQPENPPKWYSFGGMGHYPGRCSTFKIKKYLPPLLQLRPCAIKSKWLEPLWNAMQDGANHWSVLRIIRIFFSPRLICILQGNPANILFKSTFSSYREQSLMTSSILPITEFSRFKTHQLSWVDSLDDLCRPFDNFEIYIFSIILPRYWRKPSLEKIQCNAMV